MAAIAAVAAAPALWAQTPPRAEFPQPQFEREQWLTLNGAWEFEFDDANAGVNERWQAGGRAFTKKITVPYAFESKLSGIGDTGFHPWVWYRRAVALPAGWSGKRVLLRFGAVDYRAVVWVNGELAGSHEGGNTPFGFDVTPLLKAGANTVTVRAEDIPTDEYQPRGKQYWQPKSRGIFYTRTSGIWQPVWLEAVGANYLESVRITAGMEGTARFEARLARQEAGLELRAVVQGAAVEGAAVSTATQAEPVQVLSYTDATPRLWSPETPNLYDVTFELRRGGQVLDRVKSYFGFRTVAMGSDTLLLNRRPLFLRTVLDQGYWPDGILTPPSDEAMQYDIRMMKEMGFNGARKHQKIEDPRFLYWADKMGLLVTGEMANAVKYDERYAARFTREWIEAVERDYNHPSLILWIPVNESWGVPDLEDRRQQQHLKSLYALTKSLDATRPVVDNDGWEHTDHTDLTSLHDYARTGALLREKYARVSRKPGSRIPDNGRPAMIPGFAYNGTPYWMSEFGGVAYLPKGMEASAEAWGYSGVERDEAQAQARIAGLFEAASKLPFNAGYCYTQLTDVEQEINGLMTYDRKPKFDVKTVKEWNSHPRW
ncbi:MAG: glycoside hydrolase family 2 [Bryobacterales bacterium]|nr:glycoside hydrolase family 2 [Bryobacterales bacterium]